MFELEDFIDGGQGARIKVVGVGGAGGNVLNNMIASNIKAVEFIVMNTDSQALEISMAGRKVQLGRSTTRGLGAGSKPEVGRESALEDRDAISEALSGADMVFITAGMGGGTGTGAAPIVAEAAKELGLLTVAVVTKPFFYEGGRRKANAEYGIRELQERVDTLIVIPNDRIAMVVEKGTPILESFAVANDVLRHSVQGISDLILVPGLINLDFADVKTIIANAGRAVIGMGRGKGEKAGHEAAKRAILNPLLENNSIDGASGILINITGGLEMPIDFVQEASSLIFDSAAEEANIILGAVIDPDLKDEVRVTVIATGFKEEAQKRVELPQVKKWSAPKEPCHMKGSDRVLAKSLVGEHDRELMKLSLEEDPLDIPAFLRRGAPQADAAAQAAAGHKGKPAQAEKPLDRPRPAEPEHGMPRPRPVATYMAKHITRPI